MKGFIFILSNTAWGFVGDQTLTVCILRFAFCSEHVLFYTAKKWIMKNRPVLFCGGKRTTKDRTPKWTGDRRTNVNCSLLSWFDAAKKWIMKSRPILFCGGKRTTKDRTYKWTADRRTDVSLVTGEIWPQRSSILSETALYCISNNYLHMLFWSWLLRATCSFSSFDWMLRSGLFPRHFLFNLIMTKCIIALNFQLWYLYVILSIYFYMLENWFEPEGYHEPEGFSFEHD
jgi:hypothetical protein